MRGRRARLAGVASLALVLAIASAAYGAPIKKQFTIAVGTDGNVTIGQIETFTITITNKAATQQLGSCNITLPDTPVSPARLTGVAITSQPAPGTVQLVNNVFQARNLGTPPMLSRSFTFSATAPLAGTYKLGLIECRQANNYAPSTPSNAFTIDAANSVLSFIASPPPIPSRDLSAVFGGVVGSITYADDTPDPGTVNNRILYTVTVTNNSGTLSASGVSLLSNLSGTAGAAFSEIPAQGLGSGTGWTCTGSATSRTCSLAGTLAPGASSVIQAWVSTPSSPGSITNAVSVSGAEPDSNGTNNSASETTTINNINPADCGGNPSCVTSFIITCAPGGNVVSSGSTTNLTRWLVGTATFPQTDDCEGLQYSMNAVKEADISMSCPVNNILVKCDFEYFMQDIPAGFDANTPVTLRLVCNNDISHCAATPIGTFVLVKRNATTGEITIIPRCGSLGAGALCYEVELDGSGNLVFIVHGLTAGDPYVAGKCIPPHTCGPGS